MIDIDLIFNKQILRGLSCRSKISCGLQTISKLLLSVSTKTSRPALIATTSKVRQIGAYSIGLTIPGKTQLSNQEEDEEGRQPAHRASNISVFPSATYVVQKIVKRLVIQPMHQQSRFRF